MIAIRQARNVVSKEVDSSTNMAVQLIRLGFAKAPPAAMNESDWLYRQDALKATRHLKIQLKQPSGQVLDSTQKNQHVGQQKPPPRWFINPVVSEYPEAEHQITTVDGKALTLII